MANDVRLLKREERLMLMMALEMAQIFMQDNELLEDFWKMAPVRYLQLPLDGLHNDFTNLIEELDPDKHYPHWIDTGIDPINLEA